MKELSTCYSTNLNILFAKETIFQITSQDNRKSSSMSSSPNLLVTGRLTYWAKKCKKKDILMYKAWAFACK